MQINGETYYFHGDTVMMDRLEGEEWVRRPVDLPSGVSYDVSTNTLTLNEALLTSLQLGWDLPDDDLTIRLIGQSAIIAEACCGLLLQGGVRTTISGSGSLYVKTTNQIRKNEYGEYEAYSAVNVESGGGLTITGDAMVTVEIDGEALYGTEEQNEQAYMSALNCSSNPLILSGNAVLTTVIPEGALHNGPVASEEDMYYFPGGYGGIQGLTDLTVSDNATLNPQMLELNDVYVWNDEIQSDEFVRGGSYVQTGGTVNITAHGRNSVTELWEWDEARQENIFKGYGPHFDYHGLGFWGRESTGTISGGVLNITAAPTGEQYAVSAYVCALNICNGDLTVNGGEINIHVPTGCGLGVGGWLEHENGTLSMTGGQVRLDGSNAWFSVEPYGSAVLSGGEIHSVSGELWIQSKKEWSEQTGQEERVSAGSLEIAGGKVTVDDGIFYSDGALTVSDGSLYIG